MLAACKPLILLGFARSFHDTRAEKTDTAFSVSVFFFDGRLEVLSQQSGGLLRLLHTSPFPGHAVFEVIGMNDKPQKAAPQKETPLREEKPIPRVYPAIDNDLARDNLENDIPAADREDL